MRKLMSLGLFIVIGLVALSALPMYAQEPTYPPQAPLSGISTWSAIANPPLADGLLAYHSLPNDAILYSTPPDGGCSVKTGAGKVTDSCSDPNGFVETAASLAPGVQSVAFTGDLIRIYDGKGNDIFPDPQPSILDKVLSSIGLPTYKVASSVTLLVNADPQNQADFSVSPKFAHFRGWFAMRNEPSRAEWLLFNTVERFSQPLQTTARFSGDLGAPTPVPNCDSANGCSVFYVRLGVYYGGVWYIRVGLYDEGFILGPSYNEIANTLPDLDKAISAAQPQATPTLGG